MEDKYVNLHLHTDASLGDSVIKIPNLVQQLEKYGQEYCAITDHASLMNHYSFLQACKGTNVKPLFGNELYCKDGLAKPTSQQRYHLVLLAKNEKGLQNIRKLQRLSVADHFYYKPLTPHELIFENTEGIFCSTACALSYINNQFLNHNDEEAYDFFGKLLDNFGRNNVAVELQYHPTWEDEHGNYPQNYLNKKLLEMYYDMDARWIINTFDSHVLTDEDRVLRKKIQSIAWKKQENEINDTLKSNVLGTSALSVNFALESGFDSAKIIKKCIDNTHKIAEKCYFKPKEYDRVIPEFTQHKHFKEIFLKKVV